jgi:hypothetical protein
MCGINTLLKHRFVRHLVYKKILNPAQARVYGHCHLVNEERTNDMTFLQHKIYQILCVLSM